MVYFDAIRTPERGATGAAARPPSVSPVVAAKEASIDKDRSVSNKEFLVYFLANTRAPPSLRRARCGRTSRTPS